MAGRQFPDRTVESVEASGVRTRTARHHDNESRQGRLVANVTHHRASVTLFDSLKTTRELHMDPKV
jgi:hypothetical protein